MHTRDQLEHTDLPITLYVLFKWELSGTDYDYEHEHIPLLFLFILCGFLLPCGVFGGVLCDTDPHCCFVYELEWLHSLLAGLV